MTGLLLWLALLVSTPSVREVAQYRRAVEVDLRLLEKLTSVEAQKDLRSEYRNILGNDRRAWLRLHRLEARIRRRRPVVVDPACLNNPLC